MKHLEKEHFGQHKFQCDLCNVIFYQKVDLNEHNSTIHITSAHEESVENENIKQKKVKKKNIDCQHCDQKFSSDFQLNIHYKLGNGVPIQCVKCNFKACTPRGLDIHDKNCKKIESIDNDSNQMSEKNIKRKNESEIKIDVQNQPKFAKIHKLDVLFAKDKIDAKSHDEHDVTDETIEKILPILEINEHDLDLNGNDSSYKLGIN